MSATLWIPRGLPASGKTRWAREFVDARPLGTVVRLNRDDLRAMALPTGYTRPVHAAEEVVSALQQGPIVGLLRSGIDVIVDDTNLRARNVKRLAQLAVRAGATWLCVDEFLAVPVEVCIERDAARARPVGEEVIRGMHAKFLAGGRTLPVPVLEPDPVAGTGAVVVGKPYVAAPGTPKAIMVDIDGTVALHDGRNPFDAARYHLDLPNRPVIDQIRLAGQAGYQVVYCSGRDETGRAGTQTWLTEHVGVAGELFMRPAGDSRNDAIVKLELFDAHIRARYDVRWVFDDRDRVVRAWREIGLPVMQVAYGDF